MSKKTTWFHHLSEAGRPVTMMADKLNEIDIKIESMKMTLEMLIDNRNDISNSLYKIVDKNWTEDEKRDARNAYYAANEALIQKPC